LSWQEIIAFPVLSYGQRRISGKYNLISDATRSAKLKGLNII